MIGVGGVKGVRWKALAAPVGLMAAGVAAFAYVGSVDPNETGHYPTCPFLAMTGLLCPGCGGLRMTHAIAHGRFGEAASRNLLAFVMIPVVAYLWGLWVVASWRGTEVRTRLSNRYLIMGLVGAILVFSVLRNTPFGDFLAP